MNPPKIPLVLLVALLFTETLFCAAYYNEFLDAWKKKDYLTAEKQIARAYKEKSDDKNYLYWYGVTLIKNKKYKKGISYLKKISADYKADEVNFQIGLAYQESSDNDAAISHYLKVIDQKDASADYLSASYYRIFSIVYNDKNPDRHISMMSSLQKKFALFHKKHPKQKNDWPSFVIAHYFKNRGIAIAENNSAKAKEYLKISLKWVDLGLGKYDEYIHANDLKISLKALEYWEKNYARLRKKAQIHYVHFIGVKTFSGSYLKDATIKNGKIIGQKMHSEQRLSLPLKALCQSSFDGFKRLIFYYANGKLLLEAEYTELNASITRVDQNLWRSAKGKNGKPINEIIALVADIESVNPSLDDFFHKTYQKTDTYFFVYPYFTAGGTGGARGVPLISYSLYSAPRGMVHLADDGTKMSPEYFMHEFFHNIQGFYAQNAKNHTLISHVYKKPYRRLWPSWYHGEGELTYYYLAFQNIINPTGMKKFNTRNQKKSLNKNDIKQAKKIISKYSIKQRKKAWEIKKKGDAFYLNLEPSEKMKSISYYEKSFEIFPYNTQMNDRLRYEYHKKRNFKKALLIEKASIQIEPNNISRNRWIAFYYEKNNHLNDAIEYYKKYYTLSKDPSAFYNQGRIYHAMKRIHDSIRAYALHVEKGRDNHLRQYSLNMASFHLTYTKDVKDIDESIRLAEKYFFIVKEKKLKADIAFNTAVSYSNKGNKQNALRWLNIAKKNGYSNQKNIDYYYKFNQ